MCTRSREDNKHKVRNIEWSLSRDACDISEHVKDDSQKLEWSVVEEACERSTDQRVVATCRIFLTCFRSLRAFKDRICGRGVGEGLEL